MQNLGQDSLQINGLNGLGQCNMRDLDFNAWTGVRKSAEEKEAGHIKAHHALTRAQSDYLLVHIERGAGTAVGAHFILMLGMATGLRLSEMGSVNLGGLQPQDYHFSLSPFLWTRIPSHKIRSPCVRSGRHSACRRTRKNTNQGFASNNAGRMRCSASAWRRYVC